MPARRRRLLLLAALVSAPPVPRGGVQPAAPQRECPQWQLYYYHSLGHGIGLEVHDPDQAVPFGALAAGSAFTLEPGVYVRDRLLDHVPDTPRNRRLRAAVGDAVRRHANVGVRIEDDYLVTARGVEWVSRPPRDADEIEAAMRGVYPGPAPRDPGLVNAYRRWRCGRAPPASSAGGVQAGVARASPVQADVPGPVTPESSPAPTQMRPLARLPLLALALVAAACGQGDDLSRPVASAVADRAASPATSKASAGRARGVGGGADGGARRDAANAPGGFAVLTQTAPAADEAQDAAPPAAPAPPPAPAAPGAPPQGRTAGAEPAAIPSLVIRTGTAAVQVDSLDRAIAAMRATVERLGGWVANSSVQAGREQIRSATLELKIPAARFDALTGSIGTVGKLEQLDVSAEDVSEEFVDVSARVTNARRLEARLIALLERSAGRLSDVLAVERELARVREEIERYDGRLRYLRTRAAVSTLTVTLHEPLPIVAGQPGRNPIAAAFRAAWRNFVSVVAGLIASLGVLVPLAAIAAAVWFGVLPAVRRRRPPGDAPPPPPVAEAPRRDRAA